MSQLTTEFASRLRYLAETCDFESVDDVIAHQILANCNSLRLKERILREEKADLTFILKQGRILECSKQQASHISGKSKSAEINAIRGGRKPSMRNSGIRQQQESKRESGAKCRNCGQTWPHDQSKPCPVLGKTCFACGKQNHFLVYVEALVKPPEVFHAHQNKTQNVSTSTKLTNMTHLTSCLKKMKSMSIPQLPLKYRPHTSRRKRQCHFTTSTAGKNWCHTGDRYDGFRGISQHP